jgi:hypothetical protein
MKLSRKAIREEKVMATKTRQSRASRAAEQAEENAALAAAEENAIKAAEAGEIEPTAEAVEEAAAAEPEPESKVELPVVQGDLGRGRIVYFQPSLKLPDGTTVECEHSTWGHSKESAAAACLRRLAAANGVQVQVETP